MNNKLFLLVLTPTVVLGGYFLYRLWKGDYAGPRRLPGFGRSSGNQSVGPTETYYTDGGR